MDCNGGSTRIRGKFNMATLQDLLKGGRRKCPGVKPGASGSSSLIHHAIDLEEDLEMSPPDKREFYLAWADDDVALVRAWIDQGAQWPEGLVLVD